MKLFISYHLADTKHVKKIKKKLKDHGIDYYSVPENADFTGLHNEEISKFILKQMSDCHILLCIVGKETYKRPHVDYEIHHALKGGVGKRLGIISVFLESRQDTIYDINYGTFPPRLLDNINYILLVQNASLFNQIDDCITQTKSNRNNPKLEVNNTRKCMKLPNQYYEE
jgi:hypothetical protein